MTESLYAVLFSDSLVKVGRAANPARRIQQHAAHVSIVGLGVSKSHSAACQGPSNAAERALIERCYAAAEERICKEWFRGLNFDAVRCWLDECAATSAPPATDAQPANLLEAVIAELERRKGELPSVARASGLSYDTVLRIKNRENDPGYSKVVALAQHLFPQVAA